MLDMTTTGAGLNGFRILGTGRYLPQNKVTSAQIDQRLNWPEGTVAARFGLTSRHVAGAGESTSEMAAAAARDALQAAGREASDLDLIIGGCGVMEQAIPSTAVLVQDRLGLGRSGIAAFDVNATCLGFVQAMDVAAMYIAMGRARHVLVFASDIASVGLDWNVPDTACIFGDGAAAVVLGIGEAGILASRMETYGEGRGACVLAGGGTGYASLLPAAQASALYFQMDGQQAWRHAARRLPRFTARLLDSAGVEMSDIACIIPHQASGGALDHGLARLGLPAEKVVRTYTECGNQIASSIPNALHHAVAAGRLQRGDLALLIGTSAGLSIGGMVVRY
ncbi:beta-ketoacyl-ACP synthase 3 [Ketogulonicigenium vulgare]|uniref:beta-ketoacyl-ACP synthase 3 n=1 Tax=Ketogulonicigenium vulgare TaxID=92945 RepID=UPI00235958B7|nr:beta-ketoacyl-ACP synthase 3 [Ketogulonicigenium vulgare]